MMTDLNPILSEAAIDIDLAIPPQRQPIHIEHREPTVLPGARLWHNRWARRSILGGLSGLCLVAGQSSMVSPAKVASMIEPAALSHWRGVVAAGRDVGRRAFNVFHASDPQRLLNVQAMALAAVDLAASADSDSDLDPQGDPAALALRRASLAQAAKENSGLPVARIPEKESWQSIDPKTLSLSMASEAFAKGDLVLSVISYMEGFAPSLHAPHAMSIGFGYDPRAQTAAFNQAALTPVVGPERAAAITREAETRQSNHKAIIRPDEAALLSAGVADHLQDDLVIPNLVTAFLKTKEGRQWLEKRWAADQVAASGVEVSRLRSKQAATVMIKARFAKLLPHEQAVITYHAYNTGQRGFDGFPKLVAGLLTLMEARDQVASLDNAQKDSASETSKDAAQLSSKIIAARALIRANLSYFFWDAEKKAYKPNTRAKNLLRALWDSPGDYAKHIISHQTEGRFRRKMESHMGLVADAAAPSTATEANHDKRLPSKTPRMG